MKLAAIQMVSGASVQGNLDSARTLLAEAAAGGAELAVLPEYFCLLGHRDTDKLDVQEPFGDGPIQHFLADRARSLGIWIVGGTLPLAGSSDPLEESRVGLADGNVVAPPPVRRIFNSSLVFAPDGQCIQRYDKIHLFRYDNGRERYDESRVLMRGDKPAMFELPSRDGHVWKVGQSVCYDLRFPELYRTYSAAGADVLLVPSAFTHTTGQAHWEVLLRARAIENMAFVAAPAQGGLHENGRRTWGHSMQLDPWGTILSERVEGAGVDVVELDWHKLRELRLQLPALEHRVL
jgi:predicted amidohydrolase